nr:hypothetical protein [Tanacetum cinerariifolium]
MEIEESKDLTSLSLDEIIRNLKVHEMIIKKDSEIVKAKGEKKSLGLKAKKEFKCLKPPKDKNQRAFVRGSWSDSREKDDEKSKDETCLVAQASSEVYSESSYFSDENSSIDDFALDSDKITKDGKDIGRGIRKKGLYVMKLGNKSKDKICLATIVENSTLWHKRLGQANMRLIQSLAFNELVRNLPKLKFDQHFCDACKIRKQAHDSHKAKNIVSTNRCLKLLHMDLLGSSVVRSYGGNLYTLVIVDDCSRLESIRILLAYACALYFKLLQMDIESAFLNGFINEEVYVAQPLRFLDFEKPDHVYKLKKALYGLKQAHKSCLTCQDMCDEFAKIMHDKFEMSMIEDSKPMKTLMSSDTKLTKDEECESVDSTKYRGMIGSGISSIRRIKRVRYNVLGFLRAQIRRIFLDGYGVLDVRTTLFDVITNHAGDYVDRKSTSGIFTFVGCCLTSWLSKKQTALAISTTEAEYVIAGKACQQEPWMKQALIDYEILLDDVPIMFNNKGVIDLSKNPVQHSRTKHIKIRHHSLQDNVQKGHISIKKVSSVNNITDILTKPLTCGSFNYLRLGLGMMEHIL